MKICGIYGIRNVVNGKWYVGQSVDVENRRV
jgi:predicted GIY-YIG superfamily endonuclease